MTRRAAQTPYRNLMVWVESFDLALDIFQLTRTFRGDEAQSVSQKLIGASSRLPIAVARGQSSGSAAEFIACLRQGLSELTELEGQLRLYQDRVAAIRNGANRLLHDLTRQFQPDEPEGTPTNT